MLIELEEPFSLDWDKGYLREDKKDSRRRVDLKKGSLRTTISYARYLKSVSLGKYIEPEFEVDHIDGDCSNDDLSNLQILTIEAHLEKTALELAGRTMVKLTCECCGISFEREKRDAFKSKIHTVCSRSCNGKMVTKNRPIKLKKSLTQNQIDDIVRLRSQGLSDKKISDTIGVDRTKIFRVRKEFNIQ